MTARARTWLVTGSSRGIGLELVRQLLTRESTRVIAACRDVDSPTAAGLRQLAQQKVHEKRLAVVALDVTDEQSIGQCVEHVRDAVLSDGPLDVLVNNAGVMRWSKTHPDQIPGDTAMSTLKREMMTHFEVNTVGPMLCTQAFVPLMGNSSVKTIVNMSSMLGSIKQARNGGGQLPYRASKAALNMVTSVFAKDLEAQEFTVVSMHPGWVQTDMGSAGNRDPPTTPEQSVSGMLRTLDAMSLKEDSGAFLTFRGSTLPW